MLMLKKSTQGFNLVELSILLVVCGITSLAGFYFIQGANNKAIAQENSMLAYKIMLAIKAFALNQNRLPCPDNNGDGAEDQLAGNCAADSGLVPIVNLGIEVPLPVLSRTRYSISAGLTNGSLGLHRQISSIIQANTFTQPWVVLSGTCNNPVTQVPASFVVSISNGDNLVNNFACYDKITQNSEMAWTGIPALLGWMSENNSR